MALTPPPLNTKGIRIEECPLNSILSPSSSLSYAPLSSLKLSFFVFSLLLLSLLHFWLRQELKKCWCSYFHSCREVNLHISRSESNQRVIKHSESTQRALREHLESTQRVLIEHSESTQRALRATK